MLYNLLVESTRWRVDRTCFPLRRREAHCLSPRVFSNLFTNSRFPKEDPSAPRMRIVKKECPPEYDAYMSCLEANAEKPEVCKPLREVLFECGRPGFYKANTDETYEYWFKQIIKANRYSFIRMFGKVVRHTDIGKCGNWLRYYLPRKFQMKKGSLFIVMKLLLIWNCPWTFFLLLPTRGEPIFF